MSLPLITPDWPAPRTVRAFATTREGGVSTDAFASLNLGTHVGDDPARVGEYVRYFDPGFIGLSGTLDEVSAVAKSFFVIFEKVPLEDSNMGYTMDHSSIIYVVGRDGIVKSLVHHGETPEAIAKALRDALAG